MTIVQRIAARRVDLPLVAEATLWLGLAWLALRLLPFRRVAGLLRPVLPHSPISVNAAPLDQDGIARIAWAVGAAARRVPWRAVCFHEGIAVQRMLSRRAVAADLHYGVARGPDGGLPAHVWVSVQDQVVIGDEALSDYVRLATFSPRLSGSLASLV